MNNREAVIREFCFQQNHLWIAPRALFASFALRNIAAGK